MAKVDHITARLELDGEGWWCAQVETKGLEGVITQGKTLPTTRKRLRDALGVMWDDEGRAARATVEERVVLSKEARAALTAAREARTRMEALARELDAQSRKAARLLSKRRVGTRDIGELLDLSQSRIAQLLQA